MTRMIFAMAHMLVLLVELQITNSKNSLDEFKSQYESGGFIGVLDRDGYNKRVDDAKSAIEDFTTWLNEFKLLIAHNNGSMDIGKDRELH